MFFKGMGREAWIRPDSANSLIKKVHVRNLCAVYESRLFLAQFSPEILPCCRTMAALKVQVAPFSP
jgi:hypothetical protein